MVKEKNNDIVEHFITIKRIIHTKTGKVDYNFNYNLNPDELIGILERTKNDFLNGKVVYDQKEKKQTPQDYLG